MLKSVQSFIDIYQGRYDLGAINDDGTDGGCHVSDGDGDVEKCSVEHHSQETQSPWTMTALLTS